MAFCQNMEWGKISQKEIELNDVSFEPGADAVKLGEIGHLKITDDGYELLEYGRTKILSINGFENAQKKWSYRPAVHNDNVVLQDAQTINFVDGKEIVTPLDKKDIIVSRNGDIEEIAFAFPNVRVGSIIEYKVKIFRTSNLYASPWRFQNSIPTLSSQLFLKVATVADYKVILKGQQLNKKYIDKRNKNNKEWELINIPSDNIFKNVYNVEDYRERIMFQYTSARKYYGSYYSENSWKGFKNLIIKEVEKSSEKVDFQQIASKIKNAPTKFETLRNCVQYLRDFYNWNRYLAFQASNMQSEFLQKKIGNAADFNILLNGILRAKKINAQLVINSSRSNGRIIVAYPTFSKLQTLLNIVEVDDGEKLLIDGATSKPENLRFLSLDNFNYIVLGLDDRGEVFTTVSPSLSEFISQQNLIIGETNSELEVKNRSKGYFNSESINQRPLNVFQGIKTKEQTKQEGEEWKSSSHTIEFENPTNSLFVIENPLAKTLKDLTVEKTRDYPIELDFPYLATIMFHTRLPQNYKMETDQFSRKISAFNGSLQYLQQVKSDKDDRFLTWSLLINKTVFQNNEIQEYQQFITQLESVFSEVAVIKMIK